MREPLTPDRPILADLLRELFGEGPLGMGIALYAERAAILRAHEEALLAWHRQAAQAELLAACRISGIVDFLDRHGNHAAARLFEAAVAKAEGRTP